LWRLIVVLGGLGLALSVTNFGKCGGYLFLKGGSVRGVVRRYRDISFDLASVTSDKLLLPSAEDTHRLTSSGTVLTLAPVGLTT